MGIVIVCVGPGSFFGEGVVSVRWVFRREVWLLCYVGPGGFLWEGVVFVWVLLSELLYEGVVFYDGFEFFDFFGGCVEVFG